jgi:hypothetical protein
MDIMIESHITRDPNSTLENMIFQQFTLFHSALEYTIYIWYHIRCTLYSLCITFPSQTWLFHKLSFLRYNNFTHMKQYALVIGNQ